MSQLTSTAQLENLLNMLTPAQFDTLVATLSRQGLSDDVLGADGEVDESTLQMVAEKVWAILEDAK
jgi:hypothetical protein